VWRAVTPAVLVGSQGWWWRVSGVGANRHGGGCLPYAKRWTTTTSSSLSSICVAGLSGRVVRPSSFFVVAGHCVPVMWVLAVNRQWAVDRGGAVLVGCRGNRRGGAAYRMQKDERRRRRRRRCHPSAWHGSEAMACARRRLSWALVVVCQSLPLLCVGAVVVRWSWPFAGRLSSFRGWGCLRWWRLRYVA